MIIDGQKRTKNKQIFKKLVKLKKTGEKQMKIT